MTGKISSRCWGFLDSLIASKAELEFSLHECRRHNMPAECKEAELRRIHYGDMRQAIERECVE